MTRVALYMRVSTDTQTTENQQLELERVAQQRGWQLAGVYTDYGISGAKGRDQRPEFDRLIGELPRPPGPSSCSISLRQCAALRRYSSARSRHCSAVGSGRGGSSGGAEMRLISGSVIERC
jgi:hypothetical protein